MARVLVCSESDLPSVNMREVLLKDGGWEDAGEQDGLRFMSKDSVVMVSTPDEHVHLEDLDLMIRRAGFDVTEMVFMSRHSGASGIPTLTVHPIGNYKDSKLGGKERTLVRPMPGLMGDALRRIAKNNDTGIYKVSYEVTHHGPCLSVPTMFIEIGSNEDHWGDRHAAEILAHVIESMDCNDYPVAIGIGGGHYAPRFTEVALQYKLNFGHMLPTYQMDGSDDEDLARMISSAAESTGTKMLYLHRNSMNGPTNRRIVDIADSLGLERISSKDLDPLVRINESTADALSQNGAP
jgi:D-aminoacyl-tRNA deacylase